MSTLLFIQSYLLSWHLPLRSAAVECLRQFSQKESNEMCDIVQHNKAKFKDSVFGQVGKYTVLYLLIGRKYMSHQ